MSKIKVERPEKDKLSSLGVDGWGIWESDVKTFPWEYGDTETCYILEGRARVKTPCGEEVEIKKGDLVTFPKGLKCTWDILEPVKKHYTFE